MKYYHYIPKSGKGGVTLAYKLENMNELGKKLVISIAQVSNNDYYNKKIGREIATTRMLRGNTLTISIKGSEKKLREKLEGRLPSLAFNIFRLQQNTLEF